MTAAGSEAELISAIQSGTLAETAARIADDPAADQDGRERAVHAVRTCGRIRDDLEVERGRLVMLLRAAGVTVHDDRSGSMAQRHVITLSIERDEAPRAAALLERDGYTRRATWRRGADRSYWASADEAAMERTDDVTVVVRLRWSDPRPQGWLARLFRPTAADWAMVDLPAGAWWLYHAVRPVRLVLERLGLRTRDHAGLEPFLATPLDLVGPLLDTAEVGARDVLLDVGCGDGRIVVEAARRCGCRAIGVERSAELAQAANERVAMAGVSDRVRIVHGDGLDVDATDVTVAMLFLPMRVAARIVPALSTILPAGARIWLHEQSPLDRRLPPPDRSHVVLGEESVTVAHRWTATGAA